MELIDDHGRLFGLVNVVDALVVLFALAVVVAGVAFVLQPPAPAKPETVTVAATLDLGTQPAYLVRQVSAGDSYSPGANANLTVTDTYVAPGDDDTVRAILGVEIIGLPSEPSMNYDGAPLRIGRQLDIQTDTYQVTGTLAAVGKAPAPTTTPALVAATVDASIARELSPGDPYTVAGHVVATVESVWAYGTTDPDRRRVLVGLALRTVDLGDGPAFGDTVLRPGAPLTFRADGYQVDGNVTRVGAAEPRGEPATLEATLTVREADPTLSAALSEGMTETLAGRTVATVVDVERTPAELVVVDADGAVHVRDHPTRQDLTLTAELAVRETDTGPTFKGRTLQLGRTVVLDLGAVTVEATVTEL